MATARYALNFYINSVTSDSPTQPQPADVPTNFAAAATGNWTKAFTWEWCLFDDTTGGFGWYQPGNRIMELPSSVPGVASPPPLTTTPLDIAIFDVNTGPDGNVCYAGLVQLLIKFVFTYPTPATPFGSFFSTNIGSANALACLPASLNISETSVVNGTQTVTTVLITSGGPQSTAQVPTNTIAMNPPAKQTAAVWAMALTFANNPPPGCQGDVTLWMSTSVGTNPPKFFYKDPEMEVEAGTGK